MKLLGKGIKTTCIVSDVKKHNDKNCFDQKSEAKISVTALSSIFAGST